MANGKSFTPFILETARLLATFIRPNHLMN